MFYSLPYPGKKSRELESLFLSPGLTHKHVLPRLGLAGRPLLPLQCPATHLPRRAQLAEPFSMASQVETGL